MWRFWRDVLAFEFARPGWRVFIVAHKVAHKLSEFILGMAFSALIILLIYWYVPVASNKRWTAIVVLCGSVLILVWLLRATKRYHFAVLAEAYKAQEQVLIEYTQSNTNIQWWMLFKGRYDGLYSLLDLRCWPGNAGAPLTASEIQYLEADLHNKIQDHFGSQQVRDWLSDDIPDSVLGQRERVRNHSFRLEQLIKGERARQKSIADKAASQRQTLTEGKLQDITKAP